MHDVRFYDLYTLSIVHRSLSELMRVFYLFIVQVLADGGRRLRTARSLPRMTLLIDHGLCFGQSFVFFRIAYILLL